MLSPITGTRSPNIHHRDPDSGVYQHAAQADVSQNRLSHIDPDELTFSGRWTDEVLRRSGEYFDVPAKAVRRRMKG